MAHGSADDEPKDGVVAHGCAVFEPKDGSIMLAPKGCQTVELARRRRIMNDIQLLIIIYCTKRCISLNMATLINNARIAIPTCWPLSSNASETGEPLTISIK